ncbi:MAG: hypothetical protein ACO1RX_09900 [Candidatus Sericytochromatia bacterium]
MEPSRREQFAEHVERAKRMHQTGDLSEALKEYRQAIEFASDAKTRKAVQKHIDELHDMVTFVNTVENEGPDSSERIKDWIQANLVALWGGAIVTALVLLAVLIFPPLLQALKGNSSAQPLPSPSASSELPDKIAEAEGNSESGELKGKRDSTALEIEESDSRVTLTVPDYILEPFPSKYIVLPEAALFSEAPPAQGVDPVKKLPQNSQVLLVGKTAAADWLQIRLPDRQDYWVSAASLGDNRVKSPAEIDAEIKAALGGKYWEIDIEGGAAPFTYFLHVNAPTPEIAYTALLEAYRHYAGRQLLKLYNTHTHQPLKTIEVEATPPQFQGLPPQIPVHLELFSVTPSHERASLGAKDLQLLRTPSQRYRLRQPLEGL